MEWKYIVEAIIAVIILIIFVPMIFGSAKNVWRLLAEKLGIISYSPIERAVLCSYYRCVKGCGSPEVLDYCSNYWEACSLPENLGVDDNGKVCGWSAEQFPITVVLAKTSEISKEKLKDKIGIDCITTDDTGGSINWGEIGQRFIPIWNVIKEIGDMYGKVNTLYLPKYSLTKVTRETCTISATNLDNAVKYTQINKNTYYVYTADNSVCYLWGLLGCKPVYLTAVTKYRPYVSVSSSESETPYVSKNMFLRIVVKDEKEKDTSKGEYFLTLKDLGEDNGKKWCIINVSNATVSYSKILTSDEYPQFCFPTYKGKYLCFKLEDVNKEDKKIKVHIFYSDSEPSGYKLPPDASMSCNTACENSASIDEILLSSNCRDSCKGYEDHIDLGDGWCKAVKGSSNCCCEYQYMVGAP